MSGTALLFAHGGVSDAVFVLLLGVVLASVTALVDRDRLGLLIAAFILVPSIIPILPFDSGTPPFYWAASAVIVFLFGMYKIRPSISVPGR